ncbi:uncharacterized protein MELLADRAFT_110461 [Melampsora larici-populina 98AG31]|uniref:Secreted protein n=1 Tax=Melampsora larici-populina (strain 98AG31 / pathotype 3-4-7) TaxID=747676 RepID=F4RZW1_MELLP|nr:uncharacterized protein MELLADRAFT_110461 [Melampsora larici-populina 98AG31]EGG02070.1 secreted protein [Melampsora larici-populina 98AG31]
MPNSQANLSKIFYLWLFIATMSQVSGKNAATYLINWRTTAALTKPSGQAKLLMVQEGTCKRPNIDSNFSALFSADSIPTKWKMDMTHAKDDPFTDHEGQCRSRSKVTLAISQDDISIHIHLNHLCSDSACHVDNLSGQFSCSVLKAPDNTDQFFSIGPIKTAKEHKCTR